MGGSLRALRHGALPLFRVCERMIFGGRLREAILRRALKAHHASLVRRGWTWSRADRIPHFFDHRIDAFQFLEGDTSADAFLRGYSARAVIRDGDVLLDIGCGDGFFDRRFFSDKCALVDAIDIDTRAIEHASRFNEAPNISYWLRDAVVDPFPRSRYDVIVWDGAIAHLSPQNSSVVLTKIHEALQEDGIFVGSEGLMDESADHLQKFESEEELAALFKRNFPIVQTKTRTFGPNASGHHVEVFWRCALSTDRLDMEAFRWH